MRTKQIPQQFGYTQRSDNGVEFDVPFVYRQTLERVQDLGILNGNINIDVSDINNKILVLNGSTTLSFINGTSGYLQVVFIKLTPHGNTVTWPPGMDTIQDVPDISEDREYWLMFLSWDGFASYRWAEWK